MGDAIQVFQKEADRLTADKQRRERDLFNELKEPFLTLRKELEEAQARYEKVKPEAVKKIEEVNGIPWRALGFQNPPGFVRHYLQQLYDIVSSDGKLFTDLIQQIDNLSIDHFPHGQSSPIPRTIRDLAKGGDYADSLTVNMRALNEELEKYAGRIKAGLPYVDVKIAGEVPPAVDSQAKPKVKREFSVFDRKEGT